MNLVDSPFGIFSCWVRNHVGVNAHTLFDAVDDALAPTVRPLQIYVNGSDLFLAFSDFAFFVLTDTAHIDSTSDPLTKHLLVSWDMSGGEFVGGIYIDDVSNTFLGGSFTTTTLNWSDVLVISILNNCDHTQIWNGCVGDFYLNTEEYLDFSVEENRRLFISETFEPVSLGANGELPTGTAPRFFFTGDIDAFPINQGTFDGSFTESGVLTECGETDLWYLSQDFPPAGYFDDPQAIYGFEVCIGGNEFLATCNSDPLAQIFGISNLQLPWIIIAEKDISDGSRVGGGTLRAYNNALYWAVGQFDGDIEIYESTEPVGAMAGHVFTVEQIIPDQGIGRSSVVFDSDLYVGTDPTLFGGNSPEIWQRDSDGVWTLVHAFSSDYGTIWSLKAFNGFIYAGVSGDSVNYSEVWKSSDGASWSLVKQFVGASQLTSLEEYDGNLYALLYSNAGLVEGEKRWVYRTISDSDGVDDTLWEVSFVFPNGSETSITTQLCTCTIENNSMLYAGLGDANIEDVLDALVYVYDGISWRLSENYNSTFSDPNPTVTALGYDNVHSKVYAATGSYTKPITSVTIYTRPSADNPA